jgi:O-antigen ligase
VYTAGIGQPHNDYLRLLHDYGLVGTTLWVIGYAFLLARTWRAWHSTAMVSQEQKRDPGEQRVHAAAFLALAGVAIAMITDNAIVYLFLMGPLGVLVGLSLGLSRRRGPGASEGFPA